MKLSSIVLLFILTCTNLAFAKCFEGNCENGNGTLYGSDGTVYVGQFKDGIFNGQGSCFFTDGSYYNGAWLDGKFHGKGMYISAEGKKRIGLFLGGKFIEPLPPSEVAEGLVGVTQLQSKSPPSAPPVDALSVDNEGNKISILEEPLNKTLESDQKKITLEPVQEEFPGNFPEASKRKLTVEELKSMSPSDLKLMRNEVFARHSYIFSNPKLKSYFKNFSWYSEKSNDVFMDLSEIEKANILVIKEYENNTGKTP